MNATIGIDVGGTFTDFALRDGNGVERTHKTLTTHYDLSVGFMKGMRRLAEHSGMDLAEFLGRLGSIRYSTTIGTNALIERRGPKLGLITTAGFEDTIHIGRGRSWADGSSPEAIADIARIRKPPPLVAPEMVVGLRERIDYAGKVLSPLTREEIIEKLQVLVDRGAQGFAVCLLWSFVNPTHERMVKRVIEEEYPEDYLGSMPVMLSSDVSPKAGEYARMATTMVNAYIHGIMADDLNRLGSELADAGFTKPLTLVHNTGGTKKASRTRAVLTHNAGPVAGLYAARALGRVIGSPNVIFTDMGGTSFDIGLATAGEIHTYDFIPVLDRWRSNIPAVEVKSIGAGGGSIAWVNALMSNALEVGPQSAGSMPGPACYDQGGSEPTVTDADLVLGYYNPDNYLGGSLLLDADLSRQAVEDKIARPLRVDVHEAAHRIRRLVDARMGQEVFNEVGLKGHDPRTFTLLACGGAGAAHACGFAAYVGVSRVVVPDASSVFGAYGAALMETREVWERSRAIRIFQWAGQRYSTDCDAFNSVVRDLRDRAARDLRLEGYRDDQMTFTLDLDMRFGSQYTLTKIRAPKLEVASADDFRRLCDLFVQRYSELYSPESTFLAGGVNIECFSLTASVPRDVHLPPPQPLGDAEPRADARRGARPAYWSPAEGMRDTPVYDLAALLPGNRIAGPALIEGAQTTYVIEPGWRYEMDGFRNGVLTRA
ncbi:MAG: hydantoinase/oxoprolinase family protein [Deltaproteobacteria bacterium]|nr:hydantoinase/oxoprolinase family protein [Deltaproteobacteria bacterium]